MTKQKDKTLILLSCMFRATDTTTKQQGVLAQTNILVTSTCIIIYIIELWFTLHSHSVMGLLISSKHPQVCYGASTIVLHLLPVTGHMGLERSPYQRQPTDMQITSIPWHTQLRIHALILYTYHTNDLKCSTPKLVLHVHHCLAICSAPQVVYQVFSGHFIKLWH